jgi:hypothetical protein
MFKNQIVFFLLFYMSQSCPYNDQLCVSCKDTKCLICHNSYIDIIGKCQLSKKKITNCLVYENDGVCKFCKYGYNLNNLGECEKIKIQNCWKIDEKGQCVICKESIKVKNGKCDGRNKCVVENCELCEIKNSYIKETIQKNPGVKESEKKIKMEKTTMPLEKDHKNKNYFEKNENCVLCKKGYILKMDLDLEWRCFKQNDSLKDCAYGWGNEENKCGICDFGFFDKNGICVESPFLKDLSMFFVKLTFFIFSLFTYF